jgi:zinc/manganese transport system substrate-binding protein
MKFLVCAVFSILTMSALHAQPIKVATLSSVLADIARNVGGDRVEVLEIVKPGTDPHLFDPSPGDIKKISTARIVLASGLGFETYLDKLRSSVGKVEFVVAGDVVKPILSEAKDECQDGHHHHSHGDKVTDPHWWHSISNVELVTRRIRDAFIAADPEGRSNYEANYKAYDAKLAVLSKWVRLQLARLPKNKRILVTSHDALGYFAKDHGFEVLPVQGISTSDQPSSQKVRNLIQQIKDNQVKAIFAENIENPKVLQQITKETGAKIGGTLYADGLGHGVASTYDGMVRANVTAIVEALK